MNPSSPNNPREQMEVRIVAFLLGEASPFETAEIEAALAQDKELAAFHDQMKRTIGLVQETTTHFKPAAQPAAPLPKLSPERREKLLQTFKVIAPQELAQPRAQRFHWSVTLKIAAAIIGVLVVASVLLPKVASQKYALEKSVSDLTLNFGGRPVRTTALPGPAPLASEVDLAMPELKTVNWSRNLSATKSGNPPPPAAPVALSVTPVPSPDPVDVVLTGISAQGGTRVPIPIAGANGVMTVAATDSSPKPDRRPVFLPAQLADAEGESRKTAELFGNATAPVAGQSSVAESRRRDHTLNFSGGALFANGKSDAPSATTYQWGDRMADNPAQPLNTDAGVRSQTLTRFYDDDFASRASGEKHLETRSSRRLELATAPTSERAPQSEGFGLPSVKTLSGRAATVAVPEAGYVVAAPTPEAPVVNYFNDIRGANPRTGLPATPPPAAQPASGGETSTPLTINAKFLNIEQAPAVASLPVNLAAPTLKGTLGDPPKGERIEPLSQTLWADASKQPAPQNWAYGATPSKPAPTDEFGTLKAVAAKGFAQEGKAELAAGDTVTFGFQTSGGLGGSAGRSSGGQGRGGGGRSAVDDAGVTDLYVSNPEGASQKLSENLARPAGRTEVLFDSSGVDREQALDFVDHTRSEGRSKAKADAKHSGKLAESAIPALGDVPVLGKLFRKAEPQSAVTGLAAAEPVLREQLDGSKEQTQAPVLAGLGVNGRMDANGTVIADGKTVLGGAANRIADGEARHGTFGGRLANQITSGSGTLALGSQTDTTWEVKENAQPAKDNFALGESRASLRRSQDKANLSDLQSAVEVEYLAKLKGDDGSAGKRGSEVTSWYGRTDVKAKAESRPRQLEKKSVTKAGAAGAYAFDVSSLADGVAAGKPIAAFLPADGTEQAKNLEDVELKRAPAENKPVAADKLPQIVLPKETSGYAALGTSTAGIDNQAKVEFLAPQPSARYRLTQKAEAEAKDNKSQLATGPASTEREPAVPALQVTLTNSVANLADRELATDFSVTRKLASQSGEHLDYLQAKRDVETLQTLREKLTTQIIAQEIDSKIPKSMIVEIVDQAEPQQVKSSSLRALFGGDKYESTTRIQVEKDIADVQALLGDRPLSGVAAYDPYWLQTEQEKIQSKAVLGKVIEKLNLNEAWARKLGKDKLTTDESYQLLKKKLDVHQGRGTSLLEIGVRSDKPGEAAQIANKIAEVYKEARQNKRQEITAQGIDILKSQWTEQDKKVKEKQAEVAQLEKQLGAQQASTATPKPVTAAEPDRPAPRPSTLPPTPQPEILTRENNFSTFSLNVSDVSFKLAAASLQNGVLPDPGSIRVEEFLNAFHYRDPAPAPGARIGFAWERARYPFAHNRDILRLGVQTAARGREAQKPLNLVIALDSSGSMERPDRVAIVREALKVLAAQLRPQDRISVISFSRTPRLWVDGMAGGNPQAFLGKVLDLNPEGGTNLEDAMNLAYATATKHFMAQGVNRVILLTDGAANLGNVEPEELKKTVVAQRQRGIALDCFGIGWEGYDDDLLETLSRNGDGRYGFLNSPEDAAPEFADQLAGALNVSASDVKTQVEFNPQRVTSWRQIGYAKHQLKKEQFRDNTVDAAEIAAAEQGNALYVIETNPNGTGPIGTVRVRFKVPETGEYVEQEWPLAYVPRVPALEQATPAMRLAVTASAFGEWLSTSPFAAEVRLPALQATLAGVPQIFAPDPRPQRLATMIQQARTIAGK